MPEKFYAHSVKGRPESEWQELEDHLCNVAEMAGSFAAKFGAADWGYTAGLWHDLGKYSKEFQERLRGGPRVDHSTAGAKYSVKLSPLWGRALAYALAGHHGGLPDGFGQGSTLEKRLDKTKIPPYDPSEIGDFPVPEALPFKPDPKRFGFQIAFFIRMVFSCLVDADFLDTERFMNPDRFAGRAGYPDIKELDSRFFPRLENMIQEAKRTNDSEVNRIRRQVLEQCLAKADLEPGLFSLTVPTGGGKTLSSLAFALKHARKHGLGRIIYVIPYMSIIEQNAGVFRDYLGSDAVLEHHSSFDFDKEDEEESDADRRAKLAAENWDAPLIATTAVQFFESLFSARPSRCRKLHNIAGSVVILDEAQMLPRDLLLPCIEAIRELVDHYRVTVVLCTATQPALEKREGFPGLEHPREIVAEPRKLHEKLRRVTVEHLGKLTDAELVGRLAGHDQCLCVVNTRGHARQVYDLLKSHSEKGLYHLSANMCPAHRNAKIDEIKAVLLQDDKNCRLVSTSLIEAGVDASWPFVYRAMSGADSIAQAAGRCDREGKLTAALGKPGGKVFVFDPEPGLPPGHFRHTAQAASEVMRGCEDILGPEAVRRYFELLFWQAGEQLDSKDILDLLTRDASRGNFPFDTVAELFRIIEDFQKAVIIPWDEKAEKQIDRLVHAEFTGGLLRSLQPYTVQVNPRILDELSHAGAVEMVEDRYPVLRNMDIYKDDIGLCFEDMFFRNPESIVA